MSMSDIQSKIDALLRKSESSTFESERELFAKKAWAIAAKHSLTPNAAADHLGTKLVAKKFRTYKPAAKHKNALLTVIANSLGCVAVQHGMWYSLRSMELPSKPAHSSDYDCSGYNLTIFGENDAVNNTIMLFESLNTQCQRSLLEKGKTSTAYRNSFVIGFASRIESLMKQEMTDIVSETPGTDLVLVDKHKAATAFMESQVGKTVVVRTRSAGAGHYDGQVAAETANRRISRSITA